MKIELGGGLNPTKDYINYDIEDLPTVDIKCDLSEGIPCENDSVNEIISFEFLEHLPKEDGLKLLRECYRVLRKGGTLTIGCPDLDGTISMWNKVNKKEWNKLHYLYVQIYGTQEKSTYFHLTGWWTEELMHILKDTGFRFVRDSRDKYRLNLDTDPYFPGDRPWTADEFTSLKIYVEAMK